MRKALFFIFSALVLCACQGPQGPQGPKGDGTNWFVRDFYVDKWDYSNIPLDKGGNNYFYAAFDLPELTRAIYLDGNVQMYLVEKNFQHVLPYVYHQYTMQQDTIFHPFTRTIDALFGTGWVEFQVRDSDFEYEVDNTIPDPDPMSFRVVLTW